MRPSACASRSTTRWTSTAARRSSTGRRTISAALYRAVPIGITVEGANILTRNLIVFGQGAIRAHPYLLEEMTRANADPNGPRRVRRGVLEACRPQLKTCSAPGAGAGPAACSRRRRRPAGETVLPPAVAAFGGVRARRRHGAPDHGRRAEAPRDAVGAVRRHSLRALSALRRAEALGGRRPAGCGFPALEWCMETGLQTIQTALCRDLRQSPEPLCRDGCCGLILQPFGARDTGPTDATCISARR